ncbi:hypothetical protein [Streptomyces xantholiticus]|uniref:hypothetical protein n=1 Tax=Streptomyces xantholiticus TaxID=68285 RepID=UPI001675705B|nr:hypothetical protein [Streptomyces xantholiticus]
MTAGTLASCGSSSTQNAPSSSAPAPAPKSPSSDPDQAVKDKVLSAYTNMREIQIKMASDGDLHTQDLARYAGGDAATDLKKSVLRNRSANIKFTGRPGMSPTVTAVDTKSKTATVSDCFDATNWKPVYKDSGKTVELPEQRLKYPVTSQATLEGDTWLITKVTADRTKGC